MTISPAGCRIPASARIFSARMESPAPFSCGFIVDWPAIAPIMNNSHPMMAVLRCRTLQPPSRAATEEGGRPCLSFLIASPDVLGSADDARNRLRPAPAAQHPSGGGPSDTVGG